MEAVRHPPKANRPMRAAGLRKGRRHGVPRTMIERAAERRAAGDWQGACTAADMAVDLDLRALRRTHGAEFTDRLIDDLHHLVPDLVRWHFPRLWHGDGRLLPGQRLLLSRPGGDEGPWLTVHRADRSPQGGRRLVLSSAEYFWTPPAPVALTAENVRRVDHWDEAPHVWETSRHLWDSRCTGRARERWGGGPDRAPFLDPDGTPRTPDRLAATDPGAGDRAARTEWIDGLHRAGRVVEAFAAAGIALDTTPVEPEWGSPVDPVEALARMPLSVSRLADEVARLAASGHGEAYWFPCDMGCRFVVGHSSDRSLSLRLEELDGRKGEDRPRLLAEVCRIRPIDVDAVRDGLPPDELHPLVRAALAPGRGPADGSTGPPPPLSPGPVRVRCGGEWHTLTHTAGRLDIPHTDEEQEREAALRALRGTSAGCHAALEAWTTGTGRPPRALARLRDDLFQRVKHGDTDAVTAYLDAGGDPRVRDRGGRTLLHYLHLLDHGALLPRLLAGGVDLEARDADGRTPLFRTTLMGGSPEPARALLEAGAATEGICGRRGFADAVMIHASRVHADPRWTALVREFTGVGGEER